MGGIFSNGPRRVQLEGVDWLVKAAEAENESAAKLIDGLEEIPRDEWPWNIRERLAADPEEDTDPAGDQEAEQ